MAIAFFFSGFVMHSPAITSWLVDGSAAAFPNRRLVSFFLFTPSHRVLLSFYQVTGSLAHSEVVFPSVPFAPTLQIFSPSPSRFPFLPACSPGFPPAALSPVVEGGTPLEASRHPLALVSVSPMKLNNGSVLFSLFVLVFLTGMSMFRCAF